MSLIRPDTATQRIVDAITTAIVERRLMPGTKLVEQQLADHFQVSRTLIRQALNQLSRNHLVRLKPGRGAFIAEPSIEEARQIFEVRQALEQQLIRRMCAQATELDIAALRAHLVEESQALQGGDVPRRTRLLAYFHVLLAQRAGNLVLADLLAELSARCSLIALMYQSRHAAEHSVHEHQALVDAIERRDAPAAEHLMHCHLGHVEQGLQLQPRSTDLGAALNRHIT